MFHLTVYRPVLNINNIAKLHYWNANLILNFNFYCSTLSPEGESDSESSESDDDESPGGKAPNVPFKNGSSPQGSPVKQPPPAADNKMEVDPTDGM